MLSGECEFRLHGVYLQKAVKDNWDTSEFRNLSGWGKSIDSIYNNSQLIKMA